MGKKGIEEGIIQIVTHDVKITFVILASKFWAVNLDEEWLHYLRKVKILRLGMVS